MKFGRFLPFFLLFCLKGLSQSPSYIPGDILVLLSPGATPEMVIKNQPIFGSEELNLHVFRRLSPSMPIWQLRFQPGYFSEKAVLERIQNDPRVVLAQFNHVLQNRLMPNDPLLSQQWQYLNTGAGGGTPDADLDADSAWAMANGGLSALGDTIVIAVIDDGVDTGHVDLKNNFWTNFQEVPGDGQDNDGNGYVDDYLGWNSYDNTDDISGGQFGGWHGTPVAGIVGAEGNNGIGVSGVNWKVKLMEIVGGGNEAEAIAAYSYALENRKWYNQSGGSKGAFVVATNASWGTDFGQPADAPLWCAMYDSLGKYGVLSCGATANGNINVDVQGDLPTACPSDYLVTVTNMNKNDTKVTTAGYGPVSIDLGSFGENAYTVAVNDGYGSFGGTSGATPHVTGAVGLLYNFRCPAFNQLARDFPDSAALLCKKFILDGTDPNPSLDGITASGGRQNLHKMLVELENWCSTVSNERPLPTTTSLQLHSLFPTPSVGSISIYYSTTRPASLQVFDVLGKILFQTQVPPVAAQGKFDLSLPLLPNGVYWVRLAGEDGQSSSWLKWVKMEP